MYYFVNPELPRYNRLAVLIPLFLLFITACINVPQVGDGEGDEEIVGFYGERRGMFTPNSEFSIIATHGYIPTDFRQLGRFMRQHPDAFDRCKFPSPYDPVLFSVDPTGKANLGSIAYVIGDSDVIYVPSEKHIELRILVHELFHALCESDIKDDLLEGWSESQKSFTTRIEAPQGGGQIEVEAQQGYALHIRQDGELIFLRGIGEMAASAFALPTMNEFDPGYSDTPTQYTELFDMTEEYLESYSGQDVDYMEMLGVLNTGFEKGRQNSQAFTIVVNELENFLRSKGVLVGEDFKTGYIEKLIEWELSNPTSNIPSRPIMASTLKNKWTRELLEELVTDAKKGNIGALVEIEQIISAQTKEERDKRARRILGERYRNLNQDGMRLYSLMKEEGQVSLLPHNYISR